MRSAILAANVSPAIDEIVFDLAEDGGDGIDSEILVLNDSFVTRNEGWGVRSTNVTLRRTEICDNAAGDLIASRRLDLEDSVVCDRSFSADEGCACASAHVDRGELSVILGLLCLGRSRFRARSRT